MFESVIFLIATQVAKPTDSPKEAAKAPAKQEAKESKQPVRLRRRGDTNPTDDKAKKSTDEAPAVESRNIPKPDATKKKSELDDQLLRELAQGLESPKQDESDPLLRAQRRMRHVEEELAKTDATTKTVDTQKKIVADLDELLNQAANQQQKKKQQKQNKNQQKQKQQQQSQANSQRQNNGNRQGDQASKESAKQAGAARSSSEQRGEGCQAKDIWGHLTRLEHQELMQYAKEQYLPKYREMLEQYFSNIATKSRTKSD